MFEKVKEWFLGIVDKVKSFFTKDIKEDVTVNYGGLCILAVLAGFGIGDCVMGIINFIPKLLVLNTMVTVTAIYLLLSIIWAFILVAILNTRKYVWRAI